MIHTDYGAQDWHWQKYPLSYSIVKTLILSGVKQSSERHFGIDTLLDFNETLLGRSFDEGLSCQEFFMYLEIQGHSCCCLKVVMERPLQKKESLIQTLQNSHSLMMRLFADSFGHIINIYVKQACFLPYTATISATYTSVDSSAYSSALLLILILALCYEWCPSANINLLMKLKALGVSSVWFWGLFLLKQ